MSVNVSHPIGGIRERRKRARLSQQALAERAGCSLSYVALLERGFVPDASDVLPRIEHVLDDLEPAGGELEGKVGAGAAHDRAYT
jgi:transcriptional regulator with XRE-family HTH domain